VTEPEGDDLHCDAGLQQVHRGGVSERMRRDVPFFQGRALAGGALHDLSEAKGNAVAGKRGTALTGEHGPVGADLVGLALAAKPLGQGGRYRNLAFLAPLAMQADDTAAEILAANLKQLRDAGTGVVK
jgi:hypothetical protein